MMLIFVVTLNFAIALLNFFFAWKLWRSRRHIKQATRWLRQAEQVVQERLVTAPDWITLGQLHIRLFRQSTHHWLHQWSVLQELLSALIVVDFIRRRNWKGKKV